MANKKPSSDDKGKWWPEESKGIELKIHDACCKDETQKVTHFLLRRRKDINTKLIDKNGSLLVAIGNNNLFLVDALLNIGCNPNATNSNKEPALFVAFANGNMCTANSLLNHGANIEDTLLLADRKGLDNIVEKVIELNINEMDVRERQSPLHAAIEKRNLEIVKLLLRHNVDANRIDNSGKTPLSFAVAKGNIKIIKELLNNGAQVDGKSSPGHGYTPFLNALFYNEIDQHILKAKIKAKILLNHGANIDICWGHGMTALHIMARDGRLDRVKILLKHKANINAVSLSNRTPLHYATMKNRTEVVETLLINGANVNLQDRYLCPPFQYAQTEEVLNIFFEYAIDLNIRNREGDTALENDIRRQNIRFTKMIIYHEGL